MVLAWFESWGYTGLFSRVGGVDGFDSVTSRLWKGAGVLGDGCGGSSPRGAFLLFFRLLFVFFPFLFLSCSLCSQIDFRILSLSFLVLLELSF